MECFFKLVGWFFPDKMRETKKQESLVERTLLLSRTYSGLAVVMCSGCFMLTGIRNEITIPKQQSRNDEALKLAQQILDKKVKNPSPTTVHQANRNEMWQLIENSQTEKVVPAPESRTSVETKTTGQQTTGRDKFSETVPRTFAPP
jgi:hypothetical protein